MPSQAKSANESTFSMQQTVGSVILRDTQFSVKY